MATGEQERLEALLERDGELGTIENALDDLLAGSGRLLIVEGPAGIGKTSLLAAARDMAGKRAVRVLAARATQLESEFTFGAVRQLLEAPLRSVPSSQRTRLLEGSAAPAAGVLGLAAPAGGIADGGLRILYGLYWLIANLAERDPLLVTIDDAHWMDPDSLRLLAFLVPRLRDLRVLLLVAARSGEWQPGALLGATASDPASRPISPAALSGQAVRELVARRWPDAADAGFARACHEASGGNPFLVTALLDELLEEGIRPSSAGAARARSLRPRTVTQAVATRLARLPAGALRLAQAVAVLGDGTPLERAARVARLDVAHAGDAADVLARAAILDDGQRLAFAHPLVRNAVYEAMGRAERGGLHRRAAHLLASDGAAPEGVAAQLAALEPAGDPEVVEALRAAARDALARGATRSAIRRLRRALEEPPAGGERGAVLRELGTAEALIQHPAAGEHLSEAFELTADPRARAEIAVVLAGVLLLAMRTSEVLRVVRRALAGLAPADADLRARLEAVIRTVARVEPRLRELRSESPDELAARAAGGSGFGARALAAHAAWTGAHRGAPATVAVDGARRALGGGVLIAEDNGGPDFTNAVFVLVMADSEHAMEALAAGLRAAGARGDVRATIANRVLAAQAHLARGDLDTATAYAEECLEATAASANVPGVAWSAGILARSRIERGELDGAQEALTRAGAFGDVPDHPIWQMCLDARARLLLARGDAERALADALELGRRVMAIDAGNPAWCPWRSTAAVCLARLEREPERARALAAEEVELARSWGAPQALGVALRAEGLVAASGERARTCLIEAVEVLDGSPARLELARALVDLGATMRRAGRLVAAREPLDAGLSAARSCGARPLVERAYDELAATGRRPRRVLDGGVNALTPSERRVARLAATGMSNRRIAQDLFVTVKTVEFHLTQVYRKLDVASRAELPGALDEAS